MISSPDHLRMSLAAAMTLGYTPGVFYRDARLYCINLLLTYPEGCRGRCAYCGLAAGRAAPAGGFNQRTLRSLHVTTVFESGLSSRFHQIVYQPMTDEAAASAREYAFVYQADRQQVQLRAGKVYVADQALTDFESGAAWVIVEAREPRWAGFAHTLAADGFFLMSDGIITSMEEEDLWNHGY